MAQPVKKGAGLKGAKTKFSLDDFKANELKMKTVAEKPMEWFIMPKGYQDALSLPGIPKGWFSGCYGWNSTGKSTIKNCLIASAQRQNVLPVIFETEGNFDFAYAIKCGMKATPIMGVDEETGEEIVEDYKGHFILFTNESMCEYCGDIDYSTMTKKPTKRRVAVIEDIAYIINDLLDKQENGELPLELLFIWDSVGSISSWRSYTSKSGNNMFDANAISTAFNTIVNTRIPSSRSQNSPYTNTFFIVNKIWDSSMATMGKPSVKLKGGNSFEYALRLLISCGKVITNGVKKLEAQVKGEKYEYGSVAPVAIKKNHLPSPFNVTREGLLYCVNSGIIAEDELEAYKKKILPDIVKQLKLGTSVTESDVTFTESEEETL
ncbi:MAG: hypothetical protein J6Y37_07585 [Paludibacteraceae bacterium]|nr:hypothetical protein [Paludibacteraceae bacterium]